jgi:hypothetical protein
MPAPLSDLVKGYAATPSSFFGYQQTRQTVMSTMQKPQLP